MLSDGGMVHLRPIVPGDADGLRRAALAAVRAHPYLRYFAPYPQISAARPGAVHRGRPPRPGGAGRACSADEMIAVGRYERNTEPADAGSAEVAFVVEDAHQGRGLGSILLEHLAAAARERGDPAVRRRGAGGEHADGAGVQGRRLPVSREFDAGVLHLEFDIDADRRARAGGDRAGAAGGGPQRSHNAAAPAVGRGDRRLHRPGQDRPRRAASTCCAAASPGRSTRSTRRPGRCAASGRTRP